MSVKQYSGIIRLDDSGKNVMYTNSLYDTISKKMINFVVIQFYSDKNNKTHQVIKHDFSHGCYNIHKYFLGHSTRIEVRGEELSAQLFHRIKNDIRLNWKYYLHAYCLRYLPMEL